MCKQNEFFIHITTLKENAIQIINISTKYNFFVGISFANGLLTIIALHFYSNEKTYEFLVMHKMEG